MRANGLSMMPEELEVGLDPQGMANLLTYLLANALVTPAEPPRTPPSIRGGWGGEFNERYPLPIAATNSSLTKGGFGGVNSQTYGACSTQS